MILAEKLTRDNRLDLLLIELFLATALHAADFHDLALVNQAMQVLFSA